jgi:hypothetical protein
MLDFTPGPSILYAYCHSDLGWKQATAELIDNAFDAEAQTVSISFHGGTTNTSRMTIVDDGTGFEDPTLLGKLGQRKSHKTTKSGCYGVGAKDAALWVGGENSRLSVVSNHGGKRRSLVIDWQRLSAGVWLIPDSELAVCNSDPGERGTKVSIAPTIHRLPEGVRWTEYIDYLGYTYGPAIRQGRQITVRRSNGQPFPIRPYELPKFESGHIETEIEVLGKRAKVTAGIVAPGVPNRRSGITYAHEFRVIKSASGYGCGAFDFSRIAGVVDLTSGWTFTKNKNDISRNKDELFEAVFRVLEPLLKRAEVEGQRLESAQFDRDVDALLNETVFGANKDRKAIRENGNGSGTKRTTGNGAKHKRAKRDQEGSSFLDKATRGGLRITYYDDVDDDGHIGRFSPPRTIQLNTAHAFVRAARQQNPMAIVAIAAPLIVSGLLVGEQPALLSISDTTGETHREKFESALGRILRDFRLNGKDVQETARGQNEVPAS